MKMLINISTLSETEDSIASVEDIYSHLEDFYNDYVPGDVWLPGMYDGDVPPCLFGANNPEDLIQQAMAWNDEIRAEVDRTLAALQRVKEKNGGVWPLDQTEVYQLRAAVQALDNHFDEFGDWATWCDLDDELYPGTILTKAQLEHIQTHPEQYAIIEIHPQ